MIPYGRTYCQYICSDGGDQSNIAWKYRCYAELPFNQVFPNEDPETPKQRHVWPLTQHLALRCQPPPRTDTLTMRAHDSCHRAICPAGYHEPLTYVVIVQTEVPQYHKKSLTAVPVPMHPTGRNGKVPFLLSLDILCSRRDSLQAKLINEAELQICPLTDAPSHTCSGRGKARCSQPIYFLMHILCRCSLSRAVLRAEALVSTAAAGDYWVVNKH